jgi:hypothetical protein
VHELFAVDQKRVSNFPSRAKVCGCAEGQHIASLYAFGRDPGLLHFVTVLHVLRETFERACYMM